MKVLVHTPFRLNINGTHYSYAAGEQDMPEDHVNHWYSKLSITPIIEEKIEEVKIKSQKRKTNVIN
jgi:hypothetical protein